MQLITLLEDVKTMSTPSSIDLDPQSMVKENFLHSANDMVPLSKLVALRCSPTKADHDLFLNTS